MFLCNMVLESYQSDHQETLYPKKSDQMLKFWEVNSTINFSSDPHILTLQFYFRNNSYFI